MAVAHGSQALVRVCRLTPNHIQALSMENQTKQNITWQGISSKSEIECCNITPLTVLNGNSAITALLLKREAGYYW